jgi:hypothetical protein
MRIRHILAMAATVATMVATAAPAVAQTTSVLPGRTTTTAVPVTLHYSPGHHGTRSRAVHPDVAGVGVGVYTTINYASLFQCPDRQCNQGVVTHAFSDDVAAICDYESLSPWGHDWVLVFNHANNQVGYIDAGFLSLQFQGENGTLDGCGTNVSGADTMVDLHTTINNASLFQCPYVANGRAVCNQGVVNTANDDVAGVCALPLHSPWGHNWILVMNRTFNNHEVGFMDAGFLTRAVGNWTVGFC